MFSISHLILVIWEPFTITIHIVNIDLDTTIWNLHCIIFVKIGLLSLDWLLEAAFSSESALQLSKQMLGILFTLYITNKYLTCSNNSQYLLREIFYTRCRKLWQTDRQTDGQTDRPTKLGTEAPSPELKKFHNINITLHGALGFRIS